MATRSEDVGATQVSKWATAGRRGAAVVVVVLCTILCTMLGTIIVAACATPPSARPSSVDATSTVTVPRGSLYDRLGGKAAIATVVDGLLTNIAADGRIRHRFVMSDVPRVRERLIEFVCQATGGPCVYRGKDMRAVHHGQRIDDAAFDALVDDLTKALDVAGVAAREKGELLGALAGMRGDVVGQ